jgi:hypothetical protein
VRRYLKMSVMARWQLYSAAMVAGCFLGVYLLRFDDVVGVATFTGVWCITAVAQHALRCPQCDWPALRRKGDVASSIRFLGQLLPQ